MSAGARSPFLFDWLLEAAEATPEAPCVGTPDGWLDYRAMAKRVLALAGELAERGVKPKGRVVIALPNNAAAVTSGLAAQWLGASAVEVSREWGREALAAIVQQAEAQVAVIQGRDVPAWGELLRRLRHVVVVHPTAPPERMRALLGETPWTHLSEGGELASTGPAPEPSRDSEAAALLVYTSGSTGTPRAVVQTHRNIAANTRSICAYLELKAEDRVMSILPLHYCYGKSLLQTHLFAGASVFFDHRFMYPRVVMEAIGAERCTGFAGVPLTFELLRRQVDPRGLAMPALRYLTQAGGAMHPDTIAWVREAFAPARLFVMYGQTEATARLSYLPPERAADKAGSIGRGIPGVELRIVDDGGAPSADGQVGQLIARGENVTPGYFGAPEETAAILRDGWLWTGDLGYRDPDGFFFLTGRAKDMLKLGGHRVSAVEIEQLVATHPDVLEVAVVGVTDEVGGEAAVAFVVRQPGVGAIEAELRKHVREQAAAYKVPKQVLFVDALPRTGTGKISKSELKARLNR